MSFLLNLKLMAIEWWGSSHLSVNLPLKPTDQKGHKLSFSVAAQVGYTRIQLIS